MKTRTSNVHNKRSMRKSITLTEVKGGNGIHDLHYSWGLLTLMTFPLGKMIKINLQGQRS